MLLSAIVRDATQPFLPRKCSGALGVWVKPVEREVDAAGGDQDEDDAALGSTVLLQGPELPHAALADFTTPL